MANQSLIADLLKTPSQIRKEREERLLTEGLAQAQLFNQGNRLGGVGGMFASFGAQQAANVGRGMDQAVTALRDAASSATGKDFRRGEERVAGEAQSIMRGVDTNNPQSMLAAANKLATINPRASEALRQRAQTLQASQAKSSSEARQQQFENQLQLRDRILEERRVAVSENKSQAEIDDIVRRLKIAEQKLPLELRSMAAETAAAETDLAFNQATFDSRVSQVQANLAQTLASTDLTETQIADTQEKLSMAMQKFPAEMNALLANTEATAISSALTQAQTDRMRELTPLEVQATLAAVAKDKAYTDKLIKEAARGETTPFLTEVNALVASGAITEQEAQSYIKQRTEARAKTGGIQGVGTVKVSRVLKAVDQAHSQAANASQAMTLATQGLSLVPEMDAGILRTGKEVLTKIGTLIGIEESQRANFANQFVDVLTGKMTLEAAGAMKGALSDKDVQFLKDTVGNRDLNPTVLAEVFTQLYIEKSAEQFVSEQLESRILGMSETEIADFNVVKAKNLLLERGKVQAQETLNGMFGAK
jgi:hypothetical protein